MNDTPLHFALRRTQARIVAARTWVGIVIVGVLLGLIGPFNTFEHMSLAARIGYWLANAAGGYLIGFFFIALLQGWLRPDPTWRLVLLSGLISGLPVALFAYGLNVLVFDQPAIDLPSLLVYCPLIAVGIMIIRLVIVPPVQANTAVDPVAVPAAAPAAEAAPPRPVLLDRLPHARRGPILHLAVADHYVDVTTGVGTTLVLIRLSDAIREAAPTPGLQVHRSHWVALDAVKRGLRQAGKPVLELADGTIVPISRSYLDAARAAGLLAR